MYPTKRNAEAKHSNNAEKVGRTHAQYVDHAPTLGHPFHGNLKMPTDKQASISALLIS